MPTLFPHRVLPRASALLLAAATAAPAAAPATAPSSAPSSAPSTRRADPAVAAAFGRLADPDPAVRDAAREWLMGLPADALPALLEACRSAAPVAPPQAAVLHEVVCQAFLAADPYPATGSADDPQPGRDRTYIMGLLWTTAQDLSAHRLGVPVVDRWPGFPAGRFLREGDLILGVYGGPPDARTPPAGPEAPTPTVDDLVAAVRACPTMPAVGLSVLRAGRVVRVQVPLAPQPTATVDRFPGPTAAFLADRQARADAYWQDTFAPVVSPGGPDPDPLDR